MSYPLNPRPNVPTSIKVSTPSAKIAFGQSVQLVPILRDAYGAVVAPTKAFTYQSTNPSLATVSSGLVTAMTPADPNVLNAGGSVRISVAYPFANRPAETMTTEVELTVLATAATTKFVPQAPGVSFADADNPLSGSGPGGSGYKAVPQR